MPAGPARTSSFGSGAARLIEGGLPTEATVAQVLVSKYADHLPLYRQAQIYGRQGISLDRSTLPTGSAVRPGISVPCTRDCWGS